LPGGKAGIAFELPEKVRFVIEAKVISYGFDALFMVVANDLTGLFYTHGSFPAAEIGFDFVPEVMS